MLIESITHLPVSLGMLQDVMQMPDGGQLAKVFVRWAHFVGGITWIGMLYFFNLVNVPLMKALDAPTKGKVIPSLLPRSLWYFRWGAVVTVLAGLMYYAMYILPGDPAAVRNGVWKVLGIWLLVVLVTYAILFFLYRVPALTKDGRVLAVVILILMLVMTALLLYILGNYRIEGAHDATYIGSKTLSIGVGGALGIIMLLNVWGIIWPAQKRIIAWTRANAESGTPIPPESAGLARTAFLASRTNAWLSLPMLFLMAQSHDYAFFAGK